MARLRAVAQFGVLPPIIVGQRGSYRTTFYIPGRFPFPDRMGAGAVKPAHTG